MNASLRRISVTVMALIVLLLLNATMTQVFAADGLRTDPRNQRVLLDEYSRQRGQIIAGGQLLAYSVATDSRYRFLRVYPNPAVYAPITGFYSLRYSSSGLERAEDPLLNGSGCVRIDGRGSGIAAFVIPTDEEQMIARHTSDLLKSSPRSFGATPSYQSRSASSPA